MPKQEIDQRIKNELLFRCQCGGDHFVSFAWEEWDKDDIEFYVSVIYPWAPFSWRLKDGLKYIFRGKRHYCDAVGLTSKDLDKVQKLIEGYLIKVNNGAKT